MRASYRERERWRRKDDDPAWVDHRERVVDAALAAGQRPAPSGPKPTGAETSWPSVWATTCATPPTARVSSSTSAGEGERAEARVRFPGLGEKTFLLAWTPLEKV